MKLDKPFCFMFLSVFLALKVHKTHPLSEKITNEIFLLNCAQLICEPVRSDREAKARLCTVTVNSSSPMTTLFSLLKILRFQNQSLD